MAESIFTVIGRTTKQLVGQKLDLAGGTLTGSLYLSRNPTQGFEAATKGYVDDTIADVDHSAFARLDGANFTGDINGTNLILSGDLTVNGAVTALNTTNSTINDSLILLSKGTSDNTNAQNDAGIIIERGSDEDNAALYWDEGTDAFMMTTTTSDATVSDLGGTTTAANLEVAGLKTNGKDLGKVEDFFGACMISIGTATISKAEFDAVASDSTVRITGVSSPFPSTAITTTYSEPNEFTYDLTEVSNDGTDTLVSVTMIQATQSAFEHLTGPGNLTIGDVVILFN